MCTVKKDINMPDSTLALDASAPTPAKVVISPTSAADYDLINRQQSQLLLDMIYASSNKKKNPCYYSSKIPCPGTAAAAVASLAAGCNSTTTDKTILDEIQKMKSTITDLQSQITKLPQQIVAAFLEAQTLHKIQAEVDDEDEFDKLSSASEVSEVVVVPRSHHQHHHQCSNMSTRTSMSSDIEVLNYHCFGRSSCSGASQSPSPSSSSRSSLPVIDISKEIAQLSNALNSIVLPDYTTTPSTPTNESSSDIFSSQVTSEEAKQIASNIFSHWEQRYLTSKAESDKSHSIAPMGNIRCHQEASKSSPSAIPQILPYNSAIDLNVWLK